MFICIDLSAFDLQTANHKLRRTELLCSTVDGPRWNFDVKPNNLNKECDSWSLTFKEGRGLSVADSLIPTNALLYTIILV